MGKYSNYKPSRVRLHVVAAKALLLGIVLTVSITIMILSWNPNTFTYRAAIYTFLNCLFHLLEFFLTSVCNTGEVDDDSFILNDPDLYYVYIAALAESACKNIGWSYAGSFVYTPMVVGLLIIIGGQFCRSLAMFTAGVSFHHYVQREPSQKRRLVTWGIYGLMRHPSYFGYFWWFVGGQVLLQNPIVGLLGAIKLLQFFRRRIEYEEEYLIAFFGKDYAEYRATVGTKIPFIH